MSRMREQDFLLSHLEMEEIRKRERLKSQHKQRERPFSDFLSPEARMAMKMVMKDTIVNAMSNQSDGETGDHEEQSGSRSGNLRKDATTNGNRQRHRVTFDTSAGPNTFKTTYKTHSASAGNRKVADGVSHLIHHEKRVHDAMSSKEMDNFIPEKLKRAATIAEIYQKSAIKIDGDITDKNYTNDNKNYRTLDGRKPGNTMETVEIVNVDDERPADIIDEFAIEETARKNAVEKCLVWMEANDVMDDGAMSALSE